MKVEITLNDEDVTGEMVKLRKTLEEIAEAAGQVMSKDLSRDLKIIKRDLSLIRSKV